MSPSADTKEQIDPVGVPISDVLDNPFRDDSAQFVAEVMDMAVGLKNQCAIELEDVTVDSAVLSEAVHALHATNVRQWDTEDEIRRPGATDGEVVDAKRRIDILNLQRHRCTELIDTAVTDRFPMNPDAERHTETVGMIVDRLSIMELRRYHFAKKRNGTQPDPGGRLERLDHEIAELQRGLELLLHKCLNGSRRFGAYRADKLYGKTS